MFLALWFGFGCGDGSAPAATASEAPAPQEMPAINTDDTAAVELPPPVVETTPADNAGDRAAAQPTSPPAGAKTPTAAASRQPAPTPQRDDQTARTPKPAARATPSAPPPPPAAASATKSPEAAETAPDHGAWNQLLQRHVSANGKVNYAGLKSDEDRLDDYLRTLEKNPPQSSWSRQEAMAYWMNAYNAYTVKLILNHYPLKSIKQIGDGNPWDDKWIEIGGKKYSLNQIENDILRPRYQDARIHFAINCAAKSCPPLHNRAFTAGNLNSTLETLTQRFINDERFNQISAEQAKVSQVFNWYGEDFGKLRDYLNQYSEEKLAEDAKITFNEYDWALNN